ncbi:uncharacterized protein LOC110607031 isoform X2 [Manihot esculenta]|uniref:Phytocyanin domain-containing protein n=1 Tax=Manihot esculenta TaxID=3983 RepID=A0A2C9U2P2_MANES|nr:uncharacterized protein LOC110607031 isoform X2 [Manihot esculenta]OAY23610.1 hypothetical protein MANES_18G092600v8 [Manihot esculenta]
MQISFMLFLLLLLLFLFSQSSHSITILVDGVSEWKHPSVHVGDSIIFKHKHHYKLYIFQNQRAFNLCNFTQASLLTQPNSTSYTWYPSRLGFYYFAFNNGSQKSCAQASQKLSIKVLPQAPAPIPSPTSGGGVSSPALQPISGSNSPLTVPTVVPDKSGGGMPFINSNPAVPLPTGEVDSATIRPLSASAHRQQVSVGLFGAQITPFCVALLVLL